jgi:hypothetical protein
MKRKAICKNCGYPLFRTLQGVWLHADFDWRLVKCPVQNALGYSPKAEPREGE